MAQAAPAISALWTTVQRGWGPHFSMTRGIDRNLTNRVMARSPEIIKIHQKDSEIPKKTNTKKYQKNKKHNTKKVSSMLIPNLISKNKYQKTCLLYACVIYAHGNKSPETINILGHLRIAAEIRCPKMRAEVSNRRPTNCWKRCRWLGNWNRSLYFVKPHSWWYWWLNMVETC